MAENHDKPDKPDIIDIVALVQNNPLTKLSSNYDSELIEKLRKRFTPEELQFYIANLYCFLNYNQKTDFVINLDRFWKWLGYGRIEECKRVLVKNFKENVDYKIEKAAPQVSGAGPKVSKEGKNLGGAGLNREYTILTVNCFKKLCLKSRTEKADKIHDYYVGLEEILNEVIMEQTEELTLKLKNKDKEINTRLTQKDKENEKTLIINFRNKHVVYLILIEIITIDGHIFIIIKFGFTKDIEERMKQHHSQFGENIILKNVFETIYNREFELMIKEDSVISKYIIKKKYKTVQTELIQLTQNFTYENLNERIEYLKDNVNGDLVSNLIKRINELEHANEIKTQTNTISKLKSKELTLLKQIKETPFRAINILSNEIITFKSMADASKISGIGPHSIKNNYLDKPVQHNGFVYYSEDKPYWKPPQNFRFDLSVKPSINMIMCKSIHKETQEITYYNSIKEAGKIIGIQEDDSTMRKFSWLCAENVSGKASTHVILNKYYWYKVHSCGSWIYPDLSEEIIEEKLIVKNLNDNEEQIIPLKDLDQIVESNLKIKSKKAIKKTTERFIEEAIEIHGDKYDYSKANYIGGRVKTTIICDIHGEFEQTPERHLSTKGCSKC